MADVSREALIPFIDEYKIQLERENGNTDSTGLFNKNENYKRNVAKKAASLLDAASWNGTEIGTGTIGTRAEQAVKKHVNLIGRFQITAFSGKIKDSPAEAERLFYDLWHEHKEAESFEPLCNFFGRKYDLIAYLYFIIDPNRYLPIKPSFFDHAFRILNISFQTAGRCSWENYQEYIRTISAVRDILKDYLQLESIDLLDAHSFLWNLTQAASGTDPDNESEAPAAELTAEEGARVVHKEYGEGTILLMTDQDVYVDFGGKKRIFPSDAFAREYLKLIPGL